MADMKTYTHDELLAAADFAAKRRGSVHSDKYRRGRVVDAFPERKLKQFAKFVIAKMWTGRTDYKGGYGLMEWQEDCVVYTIQPHQLSWRLAHDMAAIPDGYEIHHTCKHGGLCVDARCLQKLTKAAHAALHIEERGAAKGLGGAGKVVDMRPHWMTS